ncbi:MAG: TM2 domain-containing protein [Ruminococcus sp.]|nr:TM2 domain-containing protein [Ruminococcus sp.]
MKCPYCGAETRFAKCEFCDSVIDQSFSKTANEAFQDITQNIVQNITINKSPIDEASYRKKSVAIILCCLGFFGLGGVHRFYAGHYGTGLLWMFTGGCFGIGTVIDLITIITGNFSDSKEKLITKW